MDEANRVIDDMNNCEERIGKSPWMDITALANLSGKIYQKSHPLPVWEILDLPLPVMGAALKVCRTSNEHLAIYSAVGPIKMNSQQYVHLWCWNWIQRRRREQRRKFWNLAFDSARLVPAYCKYDPWKLKKASKRPSNHITFIAFSFTLRSGFTIAWYFCADFPLISCLIEQGWFHMVVTWRVVMFGRW